MCAATRRRATSTRRWSWRSTTRLIASPWLLTRLIASPNCKESGAKPRKSSGTPRSPAGPMPTRMASTVRRLLDGGGRTGQPKLIECNGWPSSTKPATRDQLRKNQPPANGGAKGFRMSVATLPPISPALQTPAPPTMEQISVNTIRTLSMDAVQAANSGHPGTPMAMAPVAYTLWQKFLRFDPQDPVWPNRDRFVLSIGHASMLLYSLLHLTEVRAVSKDYETLGEVSVPLDAIKAFRQLDSRCPGHPEYRWTSGVETTTGPLGQGVATSVGMAIGRQWLAARYNRPGFENLFDFNVYGLCGDGC